MKNFQVPEEIYQDKRKFDLMFPDLEVNLLCDNCSDSFSLPRSRFRAKLKDKAMKFYCCRDCYYGKHKATYTEHQCQYCSETFKSNNQQNANLFCSRECYHKSGYHTEQTSGDKHWQWNGGITLEERNTPAYALFRLSILERDEFTCQNCEQRGGKLQAHHIKGWKLYPELRWEESNLITLCIDCHRETHRVFGYNTTEDMILQNRGGNNNGES